MLYDATAGATTGTKLAQLPGSGIAAYMGIARPGYFEWAPPGLKFKSGCCAFLEVSGSAASGKCGGAGYEE